MLLYTILYISYYVNLSLKGENAVIKQTAKFKLVKILQSKIICNRERHCFFFFSAEEWSYCKCTLSDIKTVRMITHPVFVWLRVIWMWQKYLHSSHKPVNLPYKDENCPSQLTVTPHLWHFQTPTQHLAGLLESTVSINQKSAQSTTFSLTKEQMFLMQHWTATQNYPRRYTM